MEDMIYSFLERYGWKLTLIACSGILILGILKIPQFHIFDKVEKSKRKYLFAAISSLLSIAAAAIYIVAIDKFNWGRFALLSAGILGVNQTIYFVYENSGARAVVRKIGNVLLRIVTNAKAPNVEVAKDEADKIGIIDDLPKDE